ncbi:MAG: intradiol ring-cleavage dioxygenase [Chloroflexi bacterium]|nr:intradiol ring-cleavage dioxygenase [Chloroflexota bacterium]
MDNDDIPVGRILSRREALKLFSAVGAGMMLAACGSQSSTATTAPAATATTGTSAATAVPTATTAATSIASLPSCVVKPEMTVGPYFVDEQLNRSDIRSEPSDNSLRAGVPLTLNINVSQISSNACTALAGAMVDIWQCDAEGIYSGVTDAGFQTEGLKFLRGYQITDANGDASFTTIFPGWYQGRTVHIHVKIRTTSSTNEAYEFTSQFYFDTTLTNEILANAPYKAGSQRDTTNENDMHYANGGEQMLLSLSKTNDGYTAGFPIALDLSDAETGQADRFEQMQAPPR